MNACPECGCELRVDEKDGVLRRHVGNSCGHTSDLVFCLTRQLSQRDAAIAELTELNNMQLAGIMTATVQNTPTSIKDRIGRDNPYWTVAYGDVCVAVDREMRLMDRIKAWVEAGDKLAKQIQMRMPTDAVATIPSVTAWTAAKGTQ